MSRKWQRPFTKRTTASPLAYPDSIVLKRSLSVLNKCLSIPSFFVLFYVFFFVQNESYREEFLNERKEKERVLSLKDKLKRDLENAQSRISSLQEQVGPSIVYNDDIK